MTTAAVVGSTGLVGSNILSTLLTHPSITTVTAVSRRPLTTPDPSSKLHPLLSPDSSTWPSLLSTLDPTPSLFISSLATTRALAGGFSNQRKIDHDLNVSLAHAAKSSGVKVYVLISVANASTSSLFAYPRMKGETEDAIANLGFEHAVFVRPGLIVGSRLESRPAEYVLQLIARFLGRVSGGVLKDFWAQDADVIARAAVSAGLKCLDGSAPEGKVWVVGMGDIMRLGRKECMQGKKMA